VIHTVRDKQRLLNRVHRIKGQVEAIEDERGCADLVQQITSCRGATNGLLAVVLEDHTAPISPMPRPLTRPLKRREARRSS
jgi:DNA-binding FrmR family transcriptional regulator